MITKSRRTEKEKDLFTENPKIVEVIKKAEAHLKKLNLVGKFTFA